MTAISLATVQEVISRAIVRWPEARGRIERGGALIVLGHVEQVGADTYAVRSQRADEVTYTVTPGGCPCVDALRHPGSSCKHVWSVEILQIAEERERRQEQASRAIVTADQVASAYARRIGWAA